jgi:methionyl-tRNA formyltransferase
MAIQKAMKTLSLIFMGTPAFAVSTLQALIDAGHNIVAVYTAPPKPAGRGQKETITPIHQLALKYELRIFTPATLKDAAAQEEFKAFKADAAVVAAYGLLLPPAILEGTKMGCLNVHPSLLPRWRGAAPLQRTIMAGDKETGIVIMQMNAGLDTGDMLVSEHYAIPDGTTTGMLHDTLSHKAGALVLKSLEGLHSGTITPLKQPEAGVTYAKKITKEEYRINWNAPAESVRNHILGLSPSPGAYFVYNGENIKILDAIVLNRHSGEGRNPEQTKLDTDFRRYDAPPGTLLDDHLTIACGTGALLPLMVQRPGKKAMKPDEMLKGFSIPQWTVLE